MSNLLRILKVFDQHLTLPAEITLFGPKAVIVSRSSVLKPIQLLKETK